MPVHNGRKERVYDQRLKEFKRCIEPLSIREVIKLREILRRTSNNFYDISDINVKNELISMLTKEGYTVREIESYLVEVNTEIIPKEIFDWLQDNLRAQLFILYLFKKNRYYYANENNYSSNNILDKVQSCFDYLKLTGDHRSLSVDKKVNLLLSIKEYLNFLEAEDNYTAWLESDNKEQIEWTINYLINKMDLIKYRLFRTIHDRNFDSNDTRKNILALLDLFDAKFETIESNRRYTISAEKKLFIDKMKRAWSQQKYRDAGKTKKPYHLPLTKQTQERLEKMATIQNTTQTAILDKLINSDYEANFMDKQGKDIY